MRLMFARITGALFGWWWVWTEDYDDASRLRRVHQSPFGKLWVYGIYDSRAELLPNGKLKSSYRGSYLERWLHCCGRKIEFGREEIVSPPSAQELDKWYQA